MDLISCELALRFIVLRHQESYSLKYFIYAMWKFIGTKLRLFWYFDENLTCGSFICKQFLHNLSQHGFRYAGVITKTGDHIFNVIINFVYTNIWRINQDQCFSNILSFPISITLDPLCYCLLEKTATVFFQFWIISKIHFCNPQRISFAIIFNFDKTYDVFTILYICEMLSFICLIS